MTSFDDQEVKNEDDFEDDLEGSYGVRHGTLFVIDATPPMFENDPREGIPYFLQCIRQYIEILKQKLLWNSQDWMGLILFGTKEDEDSETKQQNILTVQKLDLISKYNLEEVMKIDEEKKLEHYRGIASSTAYPLNNVLLHAARTFSAIDITMDMRRIILFTCQDNPPMTDDNEKNSIRARVKESYSNIGLELFVIGLGDNWNNNIFYKDLEMLSRNIDADDYKKTSLEDLLLQVKLPSRNMAKLPWRVGENVIIDVSLCNLSVKTQYIKKECVTKKGNEPLKPCTFHEVKDEDTEVLEMDIQKGQIFGNEVIRLTIAEERTLCAMREPGIDLICIKHISYHPLYHFETPYFIKPRKSNRKDNKLLFGALLNKCDSRNLMIICTMTLREHFAPNLYTMIPNSNIGGFYLYKMPYKENIRNMSELFSEYIYDNDKKKPPTDPDGIELLKKMIKKLSIEYDPNLFPNPNLQVQRQIVETLALDLERREPPPDSTIPKTNEMRELVEDLLDAYDTIFNEETDSISNVPSKKKIKKANEVVEAAALEDKEKIREFVKKEEIDGFNVTQLKTILKTLHLKTSGKKDELINRIKEHFK